MPFLILFKLAYLMYFSKVFLFFIIFLLFFNTSFAEENNIIENSNITEDSNIVEENNITENNNEESNSNNQQEYVNNLIEKALKEEIYNDREWEVLLHYKWNLFLGKRSLVDDKKFFLAENGKKSPKDELVATIKGIFATEGYDDDNKHPYCKFPARRSWLTERLSIDESMMPQKNCSEFEALRKEMDPTSVTLIFPFLYIQRPVSMFGHTLLRINTRHNDPLLGHGVTFNALMPDDENPVVYSFMGLFGAYPGQYSVKKYYTTIFEYIGIEKRDIWEYDLNLTQEETYKLFMHLWELSDVYSDYWFLDENCSYNLLFLIEAARPSLHLTVSIIGEAPQNTVKRIVDEGLVTKVHYRPSHSKVMSTIASTLPRKTLNTAIDVGEGKKEITEITESDYSDRIKANMLDLATEILRYESIGKNNVTEEYVYYYREKTIELLKARSKYKIKPDYKIDQPYPPDESHDVQRIRATVGMENMDFYTELGYRFLFHELYDIDNGYIPNSEATLLDITVRYNTAKGTFKVQDSVYMALATYAPMSKLFKPVSWKIKIGGKQKYFINNGEKYVPYLQGGVGATLEFFDSLSMWLMADIDLSISSGYSSYAGLGLGGSFGVSYNFKYGKIIGEAYYRNYVISRLTEEYGANVAYIFPITKNNAIKAEFEAFHSNGVEKIDYRLSYQFYF